MQRTEVSHQLWSVTCSFTQRKSLQTQINCAPSAGYELNSSTDLLQILASRFVNTMLPLSNFLKVFFVQSLIKQDWPLCPERQELYLEETMHGSSPGQYESYGEAWGYQLHAVGLFFSSRNWEISECRGKDECSNVQNILHDNLHQNNYGPRNGVKADLPTIQTHSNLIMKPLPIISTVLCS